MQGILQGEGCITVPLTSRLTVSDSSVFQMKTKIVSCHTADFKPVKQEVNGSDTSPFSIPCLMLFFPKCIKKFQFFKILKDQSVDSRALNLF
jgi:hypothetical protein